MERKETLHGEISSPAGRAPAEAWQEVGQDINRPDDVWLEGPVLSLLAKPAEWRQKMSDRVHQTQGVNLGLRLRFSVASLEQSGDSELLPKLIQATLEALPERFEGLFLHAELMQSEESGLYLAWDNRPPALLTQVWLADKSTTEGAFRGTLEGPLHLNVLFHDTHLGFREAWNDGTMDWVLQQILPLLKEHQSSLHEISLARSDARAKGISLGLEQIHQERAAAGGYTATSPGSRTRV